MSADGNMLVQPALYCYAQLRRFDALYVDEQEALAVTREREMSVEATIRFLLKR